MRILSFLILFLAIFQSWAQKKEQAEIINSLEAQSEHFGELALQIWEYAEVGYQEEQSSKLLQEELATAGFTVESGVGAMPTAFIATFGSGNPVVGMLAEFDALPGVSQQALPKPSPREDVNAGHACGHHLFGTASTAAAIEVRRWLEQSGNSGTIRVYGTPAEEGGAGKVYMVREGLFDDVDAVLHWHPSSSNSANAASSLSNKSAKFRFYGHSSHAASAPEQGRSALDGVEAMNFMVNLMREHVPMESRIHYVITRGGEAPNVVPGFSEVFYYVRHPEMNKVKELFERVVKAAEGAAQGTNTRVEYEVIHGLYNVLPNETLGRLMHANLKQVGGVKYDTQELEFARELITSYNATEDTLTSSEDVAPFQVITRGTGGSTDVGDVSWMVPTAGMRAATWVPGTSAHSWQAVAAGGTSIGIKGMMVAAKTLALTAVDIFKRPEITNSARRELDRRRGEDFRYEALLGDRQPPLDYRK